MTQSKLGRVEGSQLVKYSKRLEKPLHPRQAFCRPFYPSTVCASSTLGFSGQPRFLLLQAPLKSFRLIAPLGFLLPQALFLFWTHHVDSRDVRDLFCFFAKDSRDDAAKNFAPELSHVHSSWSSCPAHLQWAGSFHCVEDSFPCCSDHSNARVQRPRALRR